MADVTFLLDQLDAHAAAWARHRPNTPLAADDLASRVRLALSLHDVVSESNRRQEASVAGDRGERRDAFLRDAHTLWAHWYEPVPRLVELLDGTPPHGDCAIDGADRLRERAERVRRHLLVPVERMIQAMHDCEEGRGIPLEDVRNELQHRVRAGLSG